AAVAQPGEPEGGTCCSTAGIAGGQPTTGHGLCAQGCVEGGLVRAQRTGGLAALASLAEACPGERFGAATTLCSQPPALCPGHPRQCTIPHAHQSAGGGEQPNQGDQAHGLWLQGCGLLLPEDQGRLLR